MIYIVKARTPVWYNNNRYEIGEELEINIIDMDEDLFEFIEEKIAINADEDIEDVDEIISEYHGLTVDDLKDIAKERGIEGYSRLKKEDIIKMLIENEDVGPVEGD